MASKDLEIALRIQADLKQGQQALREFGGDVAEVGVAAQQANTQLQATAAATDNLATKSAGAAAGIKKVGDSAKGAAGGFDEGAEAAQRQARELAELLGQIDPVVRELDRLDNMEQRLRGFRSQGLIDAEGFDLYNAKLKENRIRLAGSEETMRAAGITAGQYKQAMAQLPMQITDITTSLASGMPVWMVAIQQGGQIKDSFGGIGNAGRALLSTLNPLTLAIGGAVVATTALLVAYQQGGKEGFEFNKAIIMTGNSAGTSADQLANMAARIDGISGTQRQAAAALAEVTNAGKFTAEQIEKIATTAVVMENTIGKAVGDTVAEFKRLADEPAQAAAELNEQYNFLTAAVYEQIAALEAQGNEAAAAQLAMDTLASTMQQRAQEIAGNLGLIESAWKGIKNVAAEAWDEMLGIGRDATLEDQLADVQRRRTDARYGVRGDRLGTSIDPETAAALDAEEQRLNLQIQQRDQEAAWAAELTKINEDSIAAQQELAKIREQSLSKVEQKEKAIAEYRANVEKIRTANPDSELISEDKITKDIAAIEARYAERVKKPRTPKPKVDQELKQQEQYVAQLERQAATLGKNAEEVRQYELAEKGLTGALQARAAVALELINQEEKKRQADADGKTLANLQVQLLNAQGQQAAAAAMQIEQEYGELIERLQARGDEAGLSLVDSLINVERASAQLGELQAQVDRVFAEQSRQESSIQAQQQAGLISEIGARQQIIDLHARTATEVEKLLPQMQQLAEVTGDPAAIERVKDLQAQLEQTKYTANELSNALKSGFETGLASALEGLATGTMTLQEAATSFITSIASSMAQVASQNLAQMATDSLGGLFSSGAEAAAETAGATATAAAITSASTAGAAAMGTGITAGGTTAATAMAAAITSAGTAAATAMATAMATAGAASSTTSTLSSVASVATVAAATGGHIQGPGTGTSDSIPAMLSNWEFVTRAAVVQQEGALPFLHDFNARGMAALDDYARRVHHSTGGLAGVPAPDMPAPGLTSAGLADPAKSFSATLQNAQNFYLVDDPSRIADVAFNSRQGQEALFVAISRDPGKFRSLLEL
ncbi:phage tail length tape measure family protein [Aquipseudomonas alcaligenes]|uniref:Prophage tail length tape measure protein n=1 Tax=Aquipseudomonas alcaligenes TaxID=43263 RepID=A0A1N6NDY5_AQUAC|nr:phage tail length tape measure family protein [Pseudomonas alcaligenes]SIP90196.1 Prophage tail length tape measure protein [Pseudomonas alcaligenes]